MIARSARGRSRARRARSSRCRRAATSSARSASCPMARGASRSLAPREVLRRAARRSPRPGFEEVVLTGVHLGGWGEDLRPARSTSSGSSTRSRSTGSCRAPPVVDRPARGDGAARAPDGGERRASARTCTCRCRPATTACSAACGGATTRRSPRERLAMIRELPARRRDRHRRHRGLPGRGRRRVRAHARASSTRAPLTYCHVFPYSVRSGTTAAKLDGQVAPAVIARARGGACARSTSASGRAFARRFDGADAEVLVENDARPADRARSAATRGTTSARASTAPDAWHGPPRRRRASRVGPAGASTRRRRRSAPHDATTRARPSRRASGTASSAPSTSPIALTHRSFAGDQRATTRSSSSWATPSSRSPSPTCSWRASPRRARASCRRCAPRS